LEELLQLLAEEGEKKAFSHIRQIVLKNGVAKEEVGKETDPMQKTIGDISEAGLS